MLKYLSEDEIVLIHQRIVDETGGLQGIREPHAIRSVEGQPRQAVFGKELYSTMYLKAAVYAHNIIAHHPFLDGNKRTGISVAIVFLEDNGLIAKAKEGDFFNLALHIAEDKWEYEVIATWLKEHTKKVASTKKTGKKHSQKSDKKR
ncbi:MAG TPA: type II toxin-antitoxin system death-on-curing family toxin [Candidatus Kaiserbacteria bacterium]|nr:type II toxin-antitoxin system death-on-curing family toxin [Candidatus Kaiserbacteria bacterium]